MNKRARHMATGDGVDVPVEVEEAAEEEEDDDDAFALLEGFDDAFEAPDVMLCLLQGRPASAAASAMQQQPFGGMMLSSAIPVELGHEPSREGGEVAEETEEASATEEQRAQWRQEGLNKLLRADAAEFCEHMLWEQIAAALRELLVRRSVREDALRALWHLFCKVAPMQRIECVRAVMGVLRDDADVGEGKEDGDGDGDADEPAEGQEAWLRRAVGTWVAMLHRLPADALGAVSKGAAEQVVLDVFAVFAGLLRLRPRRAGEGSRAVRNTGRLRHLTMRCDPDLEWLRLLLLRQHGAWIHGLVQQAGLLAAVRQFLLGVHVDGQEWAYGVRVLCLLGQQGAREALANIWQDAVQPRLDTGADEETTPVLLDVLHMVQRAMETGQDHADFMAMLQAITDTLTANPSATRRTTATTTAIQACLRAWLAVLFYHQQQQHHHHHHYHYHQVTEALEAMNPLIESLIASLVDSPAPTPAPACLLEVLLDALGYACAYPDPVQLRRVKAHVARLEDSGILSFDVLLDHGGACMSATFLVNVLSHGMRARCVQRACECVERFAMDQCLPSPTSAADVLSAPQGWPTNLLRAWTIFTAFTAESERDQCTRCASDILLPAVFQWAEQSMGLPDQVRTATLWDTPSRLALATIPVACLLLQRGHATSQPITMRLEALHERYHDAESVGSEDLRLLLSRLAATRRLAHPQLQFHILVDAPAAATNSETEDKDILTEDSICAEWFHRKPLTHAALKHCPFAISCGACPASAAMPHGCICNSDNTSDCGGAKADEEADEGDLFGVGTQVFDREMRRLEADMVESGELLTAAQVGDGVERLLATTQSDVFRALTHAGVPVAALAVNLSDELEHTAGDCAMQRVWKCSRMAQKEVLRSGEKTTTEDKESNDAFSTIPWMRSWATCVFAMPTEDVQARAVALQLGTLAWMIEHWLGPVPAEVFAAPRGTGPEMLLSTASHPDWSCTDLSSLFDLCHRACRDVAPAAPTR